nr:Photosystem I assembly protein Ycf3 [Paraburkholderia busanensis]
MRAQPNQSIAIAIHPTAALTQYGDDVLKQRISPVHDDAALLKLDTLVANADTHFAAQRMQAAMRAYAEVLVLFPRYAHALHRMGLACVHTGELDRARYFLERALSAAPERAASWEHAGLVAALQNDHATAALYYRRALHAGGDTASLHRNLADSLRIAGKLADALGHYRRALEIEPRLTHAHHPNHAHHAHHAHHSLRAAARLCTQLGLHDEAAGYWLRAWALDSSAAQDGLALVASLIDAQRDNEFADVLARLRVRFAGDAESLKSLAVVLNNHDRFRDALSVARQGLAVDPHHALLHHNAASALSMHGELADALPHSLEAARLLPDNAHLQFHLAGVQLGLGDFAAGWERYRWFYALPGSSRQRVHAPFPEWQGETVAGTRFLLVGEQGRGDEIQCLRFAAWLHRQGATVDVLVSQPVAALASGMSGVRTVFTTLPPGPYDYGCHMLKMPQRMRLECAMLPIAMPYIAVNPRKQRKWHTRLEAIAPRGTNAWRRRIGIVWAGNAAHPLDRFRSLHPDTLKPLFECVDDVAWFSLQKGPQENDMTACTYRHLCMLGPVIHDFADTLAILHSLDLLITVDTSVAHLAGAAGLPVWTLIPAYGEWRWLAGRSDSPWYPSMRLFRAREPGTWAPVIDEVIEALHAWRDAPLRCTPSACPEQVQTTTRVAPLDKRETIETLEAPQAPRPPATRATGQAAAKKPAQTTAQTLSQTPKPS